MSNTIKLLKESLAQARAEHAALDKAMRHIESLIATLQLDGESAGGKRRGRPPGSKNKGPAAQVSAKKKRAKKRGGRKNWSPEQKAAAAERMRAYWAKRKRQG